MIFPTNLLVDMKTCSKCHKEKDDSNFHSNRNRQGKLVLYSVCKECRKEQDKIRNEKNKLINKDKALQRNYGISLQQRNLIKEQQENKCAACGSDLSKIKARNICVDHCHKSGKIRGVLCNRCNRVLGFVDDNKIILSNLITYLESNK